MDALKPPVRSAAPPLRAQFASWTLALLVALTALANLTLGWGLGIEVFRRGGADLPAMVPETGLACLMLAVAQMLVVSRRPARGLAGALALMVPVVTAALVVIALQNHLGALPTDRMSIATMIILAVLCLAIFLGACGGRSVAVVQGALCLGVLMVGLGGISSYMFDLHELERYRLFQGLSIHMSLVTCGLAAAAVLSRTELKVVSVLFSQTPGGRVARWFMPYALLVPVVLTLAGDVGADMGWIGPKARLAVLAVVLIVLSGSLVLSIALFRDREHEREIEALSMMEAVLSGLDAAVVVLDKAGHPILSNRRFRDLIGEETAEGWLATERFLALDEPNPLTGPTHPVQWALRDNRVQMARWRSEEGEDRVLQFRGFNVSPAMGGGGQRVLVISDVTLAWRQRASMAMTERLNAVGQLAGGVAHEVTNIFGIIKLAVGTAELIAPTGAPEQYAAILNACRRGGDLADRLQRLSVWNVGGAQTIDGVAAVRVAGELAARSLPPSIRFETELPEERLPLVCDPMELEMAVLNLVLNARNAIVESGAEQGRIVVRLDREGEEVRLVVRDSGPGIPPALIGRVTEPFFTTRSAEGGTGFGLALIDAFAQAAGGHVDLGSPADGGAEVQVVLPLAEDRDADTEDGRPSPVGLAGYRVLVAEDNAALRSTLQDALATLSAEVSCAETPEAALDMLAHGAAVDVLVISINFGDIMGGRGLAERAVADRPGLGVVFVTASRSVADEVEGLPGPVLHKPVHLGVLSRAIAGVAPRPQGRS